MGKKYYCDYCDKTMVATPAIIRTHIRGLLHKKLVSQHYQQYKDPETVLKEEVEKKRCIRFSKGECQFGGMCKYSHYTQEQMNDLRGYLISKQRHEADKHQPSFEDLYQQIENDKNSITDISDEKSTMIFDENGVTHVLPWNDSHIYDIYGDNLPPSIKKLRTSNFTKAYITKWG